ncbi:neocarzinostatin apoprotein domain-containing protein [Iamia sp.]|uniref:neocarzinostatin apoprotein domain-containing protein n=1 Tax=Iamia sp. TaxID=2722710 RepID=UPI002C4266F6|nr:neocarzinostatin apoprotein domain-containing protein [Iamia sp.]HXH58209.1 neocarzinostatin apoprotein domain-containing protein [Iamia sp.]
MTNIETRLKSLRTTPVADGPGSDDLRRRAARRARRRRVAVLAAAVPVLLVAIAVAANTFGDEPADRVRTELGPASTDPEPGSSSTLPSGPEGNRVLGGAEDVSVDVTPRTGLRDGDLVTVRVEGLDNLPDAVVLMCAGDVTADDASRSCTTSAVEQAGVEGQVAASAEQTVSVSRTLQITRGSADLNQAEPYDCAIEPAGCVLAVGPFALPPRAVLVPLTFADVGPPVAPSITASPRTGLAEGEAVTVRAEGLRPNGAFVIEVCAPGESACDQIGPSARASSDADGALVATVTVRSAVYSPDGRTDCTTSPCAITIRDERFQVQAAVPISFAPGVEAPVPELVIDPAGPYVPDQQVTVRGTGFPAGAVVRLGQCPADLDTAAEERCVYPAVLYAIVVAADGTFTATTDLSLGTALGPCGPDRPCHLGWVLNHGPTVATAPLPTA